MLLTENSKSTQKNLSWVSCYWPSGGNSWLHLQSSRSPRRVDCTDEISTEAGKGRGSEPM